MTVILGALAPFPARPRGPSGPLTASVPSLARVGGSSAGLQVSPKSPRRFVEADNTPHIIDTCVLTSRVGTRVSPCVAFVAARTRRIPDPLRHAAWIIINLATSMDLLEAEPLWLSRIAV